MAMTLQGPISEQLYAHSWPFSHFHFLLSPAARPNKIKKKKSEGGGGGDRHQRYPPINVLL